MDDPVFVASMCVAMIAVPVLFVLMMVFVMIITE